MLTLTTRPKKWEDLIGQQFVATVLDSHVKENTTYGAYLFVGASGTGKTSAARIFARELNGGDDGYMEIDAASHSGVDSIRRLNDMAKNSPLNAKFRIICIDEVHALSSQAWQALLKTLEETVSTTRFILCTTEAHKIPSTILSRACRLYFRAIPTILIEEHLVKLAEDNGHELDKGVPTMLAKASMGNMREAIKNLDILMKSFPDFVDNHAASELVGRGLHWDVAELFTNIYSNDKSGISAVIADISFDITNLAPIVNQLLDVALAIWRSTHHVTMDESTEDALYLSNLVEMAFSKHDTDEGKMLAIIRQLCNLIGEIKMLDNANPYIEARINILAEEVNEEFC